jgi:hypothetical protein
MQTETQVHKSSEEILDTGATSSGGPIGMDIKDGKAICRDLDDVASQKKTEDELGEIEAVTSPAPEPQSTISDIAPIPTNEQINEYHNVISRLQVDNEQLGAQVTQLTMEKETVRRQAKAVLAKYETAEANNMLLRAQILNMRQPPGQIHNDGEYGNWLDSLNAKINLWGAKVFRGTIKISDQDEKVITDFIKDLNPRTRLFQSLAELKLSIKSVSKSAAQRVPLVRHIFAMFLEVCIFTPFCFGMASELSNTLRAMARSTMEAGMSPSTFQFY